MTFRRLPFESVFSDESGGNVKTPQGDYLTEGEFPIIDQGKALIGGYTDHRDRLCGQGRPAIVFGDHTRCIKYIDFPFCMGADGVKVLRPKIEADLKYLYYFLRSIDIPSAGYDRHYKYLKRTEIVLPPLTEQRHIAAILDQADALRAKRRDALAQLDGLTQSIFIEMFGDPVSNDRGWPEARVSDFVAGFETGKSLVAADEDDQASDFRVLKISAVTSLEFKPEQSKALPFDYEPPTSHFVRRGDLLFSRANTAELIGATALVDSTPFNLVLPDKLWRFVWYKDPRAAPRFVQHLFRQTKFRLEIAQRASGTSGSMKNISQEKVFSVRVGLPPLALQDAFATHIQAVESLRTAHRTALTELDALFASLQHRAFSGQL